MWRDSYSIGIKEIDNQHKELFRRVKDFLSVVRGDYDKKTKYQRLEETMDFMANYVIVHFDSEEKLQKKLGYPDYKEHHIIHEEFKKTVTDFKKKFDANQVNEEMLQKFSGILLSWLINHVVRTDQKIGNYIKNIKIKEEEQINTDNYIDIILNSTKQVINSMLGIDLKKTDSEGIFLFEDMVVVSIGIFGDVHGNLYFSFPKEGVLNIVEKMSGMKIDTIDGFVKSAVGELINITAADISGQISKMNYECDITPPNILLGRDAEENLDENYTTIHTDSEIGELKISSNLS